jgi:hypothetical protein
MKSQKSLFKSRASSCAQSTIRSDKTFDLFSSNQKSEKKLITNPQSSAVKTVKEILGNHLLAFVSFAIVKTYLECIWFVNVYSLQRNQQGDSSIYFNGMVLGAVSMTSFISCGMISKYIDPYKGQLVMSFVCFVLSMFLLVKTIRNDAMDTPIYDKIALYSRYII